jgi:hypothetical protein
MRQTEVEDDQIETAVFRGENSGTAISHPFVRVVRSLERIVDARAEELVVFDQ